MNGLLTFLGTGTSMGVPTLGCECAVCTSDDPRDRRLRVSVAVRWREAGQVLGGPPNRPAGENLTEAPEKIEHLAWQGGRERVVVIDTGPDFREQALRAGLKRVDAVLYTHSHADHILGLDDLRPLSFRAFRESGPIPLYT